MKMKNKSKLYPGPQKNPVKLNTNGDGMVKAVKGKVKGGGAATKGLSFIQWIKE
tara:strand:+ start:468 stop:629 length:162 start_codon:yes stop_codon:yes gene_type:complete